MKQEIIIQNIGEIDKAAAEFISGIKGNKIIAFYAPMGAGKTTFTTAICKQMGIDENEISSPTFSIVNEYKTGNGDSVYHFDFYRIQRQEEAFDIGFQDYIDSGKLCMIEWAENIDEILPEDSLKVYISVNEDESRTVSWDSPLI